MHGLMTETLDTAMTCGTAVCDTRYRNNEGGQGTKPLWLTPREAESLLVLCAASPVSAGPGEQDLFQKLGDFFRSHCR